MAEKTEIAWTDSTFNPWEGCTKVSPGCKNCYAETRANRYKSVQWGPQGTRRVASDHYWRGPLKWDADARRAGRRHKVFCGSLCDVFEGPETMPVSAHRPVADARRRLMKLITATPYLDWLLLTKRPQNVLPLTREAIDPFADPDGDFNAAGEPNGLEVASFAELFPNVWLGTSIENQETAEVRLAILRTIPARVRFLSVEPLLESVRLLGWLDGIHWVIVGGESGTGARPFRVEWARELRDQCRHAGVAFFLKQFGAQAMEEDLTLHRGPHKAERVYRLHLADAKGGDIGEFPADLRIRQFPGVSA